MTIRQRIHTALLNSIPTDAMLHDDEVAVVTERVIGAVYPHVEETGCGLTFEDFADQQDESCADGGRPLDHPVQS